MNWIRLTVAGALGVATFLGSVRADEIEIIARRDNTLYENAGGVISNGAGTGLFVGRTVQPVNNLRRAVLQFDLSDLPAGSTITEVSFRFTVTQTIAGPVPVTLHQLLADWGEGSSVATGGGGGGTAATVGDATWIHTFFDTDTWTTPGGDFDPTPLADVTVGSEGPVEVTSNPAMVALTQGWLDGAVPNFGWILIGDESSAPTAKRIASREFSSSTDTPRLLVTFDPPGGGDPEFARGDCNADGAFNIADAVAALDALFVGGSVTCDDACDSNDDGGFNIADAVYTLSALFTMGPSPAEPGPGACGVDPTDDALGCESFAACP